MNSKGLKILWFLQIDLKPSSGAEEVIYLGGCLACKVIKVYLRM